VRVSLPLQYSYRLPPHPCIVTPEETSYSAVFSSVSRVILAHRHGLAFNGNKKLEHMAGLVADIPALRAARELGLALTDEVLIGAALSGSVLLKLQWVLEDQTCKLPRSICAYAARGGSIDALRWLQNLLKGRDDVHVFTYGDMCLGAAAGGHLRVLQYLREQGCTWGIRVCSAAAESGDLAVLRWLHEQGCPWWLEDVGDKAAHVGSVEMLLYLQQQGYVFSELTIACAAAQGHLAVCQFLVTEQCPCNAKACAIAAERGHLDVLDFLLESGCPWEPAPLCKQAVENDNIEVLHCLRQQGCTFTGDLTLTAAIYISVSTCTLSSVLGALKRARMLLMRAICPHYAGCMSRAVLGSFVMFDRQQPSKATSMSWSTCSAHA
jgi:hypothetical protein